MHTVGREETEKGLTPIESSPVAETKVDEAKPMPRPRRKKASKAMIEINQNVGKRMSLRKLEAKDVLGRHVGVRNGFRGVIVAEALIGLDVCGDVLAEMKEVVSEVTDVDQKIRAARAAGELVGQLSSLLGQAADIQKAINDEAKPAKKRAAAPPSFAIHNYNGQPPVNQAPLIDATDPHQSPDQSSPATDSSSSQQTHHQLSRHNTAADSSKSESSAPALSPERSRPLSPVDINPVEPDDTASHEQQQPSHDAPPWEEEGEEF